jgi:hypothetical protein
MLCQPGIRPLLQSPVAAKGVTLPQEPPLLSALRDAAGHVRVHRAARRDRQRPTRRSDRGGCARKGWIRQPNVRFANALCLKQSETNRHYAQTIEKETQ